MQVYCHSCDQKSSYQAQLKCKNCGSQAVQLINNNISSYSYQPNDALNNHRAQRRSNDDRLNFLQRSIFSNMDQIMNMDTFFSRRASFMGMNDLFSSSRLSPSLSSQLPHSSFIFQRIRSNPVSTEYQVQFNSGDENFQYRWQSQNSEEPKQIKLQNYPQIQQLKQQCSICHTSQNSGIVLPCGHQFHKNCLQPWIEVKNNCPCCRQKL